jgi:small subunit ribosomal protein S4
VNIPSYSLKTDDLVAVREKSKSLEVITGSLLRGAVSKYPWIEWDSTSLTGKLSTVPTREEIPETIKEQLIVELYSK